MYYIVLGDSISIDDYTGVVGGGAASQFARRIGAERFRDLTRDGCTTEGVLQDLPHLTTAPDVVTLTAGGNDFLQAAFWGADYRSADGRAALVERPLANLRQITARLAELGCPVIMNTIYDPTDGDDSLAAQFGMSPALRKPFRALNDGIRTLAKERGFVLCDLEPLFHRHGVNATETWIVGQIEPNLAGATAIANRWFELYSASARGSGGPA